MDRNVSNDTQDICNAVALRKESVDRNTFSLCARYRVIEVALRKESVDRNIMQEGMSYDDI